MDGTLLIRRTYPGVGKIWKRARTNDTKVVNAIHSTLDTLFARGRLDILEAIRDNKVTPIEVHNAFVEKKLESSTGSTDIIKLKEADGSSPLFVWLDKADLADTTKRGYRGRFTVFLRTVPLGSKVRDLPRLLESFRVKFAEKRRSFNETRAAILSYLAFTLKRSSEIYKACLDVQPMNTKVLRKVYPLTVPQVLEICARMRKIDNRYTYSHDDPRYGGGEKAARIFWTLCVTGMIPREYWVNEWLIDKKGKRVIIHGEKRIGRDRIIPIVSDQLVKPLLNAKHFSKYLGLATNGRVVPKDARNTFGRWMEESEIIETHRQAYMGHGAKNLTGYYATPRMVKEILEQDAKKLASYIERETARWKGETDQPFAPMFQDSKLKSA